jgi:hypothetical protein
MGKEPNWAESTLFGPPNSRTPAQVASAPTGGPLSSVAPSAALSGGTRVSATASPPPRACQTSSLRAHVTPQESGAAPLSSPTSGRI